MCVPQRFKPAPCYRRLTSLKSLAQWVVRAKTVNTELLLAQFSVQGIGLKKGHSPDGGADQALDPSQSHGALEELKMKVEVASHRDQHEQNGNPYGVWGAGTAQASGEGAL